MTPDEIRRKADTVGTAQKVRDRADQMLREVAIAAFTEGVSANIEQIGATRAADQIMRFTDKINGRT